MASSTRGGKRGSKPKRKTLKMYKTPGGAMQYGTPDGFRKAGAAVKNDLYDDKEFNAYDTALAGWAGAMSEKHGADAFSERMERRAQERVQERKKKSVQNKKDGGKVHGYEDGGRVARLRAKRAADTVGRKMDKDNLPHSKAMKAKKKKSQGLMNSLLKMEHGGEVCRGNGRAYQGKPKKVQVR